jgi:hypothetical protein
MYGGVEYLPIITPVQLNDVIDPATSLIAHFRELVLLYADQNTQIKLKAQFGNYNSTGVWVNGVTDTHWKYILQMFTECVHWTEQSDTEWKHIHDYFYELPDRRSVHTKSTFEMMSDPLLDVQHSIQTQVDELTIATPTNYNIRLTLASETAVMVSELPEIVVPSKVCIRIRRSFVYKFWRFDLTKKWIGASRILAERAEQLDLAEYEIEIKCISPLEYLRMTPDNYIAMSFLLKISDLLPSTLGKFDVFIRKRI